MRNEYLFDDSFSEDGIEFPFVESEISVMGKDGIKKMKKSRELRVETQEIDGKTIRTVKVKVLGKEYVLKKMVFGDTPRIFQKILQAQKMIENNSEFDEKTTNDIFKTMLEIAMVSPKFTEDLDLEIFHLLGVTNSYVNPFGGKKLI